MLYVVLIMVVFYSMAIATFSGARLMHQISYFCGNSSTRPQDRSLRASIFPLHVDNVLMVAFIVANQCGQHLCSNVHEFVYSNGQNANTLVIPSLLQFYQPGRLLASFS